LKLLRLGARGREAPVVRTDDGRFLDVSPIATDFDGAFLASGGLDRLRGGLAVAAPVEIRDGHNATPLTPGFSATVHAGSVSSFRCPAGAFRAADLAGAEDAV
jgi:hypothetical protein